MKREKNREQNASYYHNTGAVPEILVKSSKNWTIKYFLSAFPPVFGNQFHFLSCSLRSKVQNIWLLNTKGWKLSMLLFCKQVNSFKLFCSYLKFVQFFKTIGQLWWSPTLKNGHSIRKIVSDKVTSNPVHYPIALSSHTRSSLSLFREK